jgi:hypothetical protein
LIFQPIRDNLIQKEDVFDFELKKLMVRMKHRTLEVFSHFIYLLYAFDKKRDHNMLVLMFDSRFKSMQLVTMYLGDENVVIEVIKYDKKLLLLLLMEANKLLMSNKARKAFSIHSQVVIKVYFTPKQQQ